MRLSIGVAVALGTAFSFALFCVLIKHASFSVTPGMFLLNLFGLLFLLCLLPLYPMQWSISGTDMLLMAYLGIFPTAVAFILWNRALRMIPTGRSSNCALLVPILSLVCITRRAERTDRPHAGGRHGNCTGVGVSQCPAGKAAVTAGKFIYSSFVRYASLVNHSSSIRYICQ